MATYTDRILVPNRSPIGGRGFESFSEDPLLSGTLASSIISAIQKSGIASAIKHFVANDVEHQRTLVNCIISQRALRGIYLLPFQIAVRDANPWVLMTAYNRVNGTHMCEHKAILTDLFRKEWGYDGCMVSDWYGTYLTVEAISVGLDIEMPGTSVWYGDKVSTALGVGKLSPSTIDKWAGAVLRLIERCAFSSEIPGMGPERELDSLEDRDILRKLAADSAVLPKNENELLPWDSTKTVRFLIALLFPWPPEEGRLTRDRRSP
jgi:beta-glucosidase